MANIESISPRAAQASPPPPQMVLLSQVDMSQASPSTQPLLSHQDMSGAISSWDPINLRREVRQVRFTDTEGSLAQTSTNATDSGEETDLDTVEMLLRRDTYPPTPPILVRTMRYDNPGKFTGVKQVVNAIKNHFPEEFPVSNPSASQQCSKIMRQKYVGRLAAKHLDTSLSYSHQSAKALDDAKLEVHLSR
jgi:hypothetical protein